MAVPGSAVVVVFLVPPCVVCTPGLGRVTMLPSLVVGSASVTQKRRNHQTTTIFYI